MKIAVLTTDNRQEYRSYGETAPHFGMAPTGLLDGFSKMPELEIHVVSCTQKPMKSPEKLAANIWFHSLHVPKIGWVWTGYQGCRRAARRKLREIQPDIVHGQGTEQDCSLSAVFSGFPNVLTIHGNMRLIAQLNKTRVISFNGIAAKLETICLPRTGGVVCITHYTRDAVKDLARRTWVVPNAVDESFFDVNAEPDPGKIILCVGGITYRKNQNAFIRALDSIAARSKFKVVFLGNSSKTDPYFAEFIELVAGRPWCEHAGFADRASLRKHFKRASLLALPSLEDNCPMVVLEAMAAGVPVLAANVGGLPDLVTHEKNGLLCDPLAPESMRNGVERILGQPEFARALAVTAKQIARERFHPLVIARRHVEIYREVLREPLAKNRPA
jgi:glycosyltransferase involved in cell wall biosynthesis